MKNNNNKKLQHHHPILQFTCHDSTFGLPLHGRGLAGFGEDRAGLRSQLSNNVISLSLSFCIW